MSDVYVVKFNDGQTSFEVSGPSETWVDGKVGELRLLLEAAPRKLSSPIEEAPKGNKAKSSTVKKKTSTSKTGGKAAATDSQLGQLWNEDFANSLLAFVKERQAGFDMGVTKEAAVVAVFLKDNAHIDAINPADMDFIYRKLSWKTINHLTQLRNALQRDKFFEKTDMGYELIHAGLVFGRDASREVKGKK